MAVQWRKIKGVSVRHGWRHTLVMGRRLVSFGVVAAAVSAFLSCAAPNPPAGRLSPSPAVQPSKTVEQGELVGNGMVLQEGHEDPQFCLGISTSSYPPLCSGPLIHGWDWAVADGETNAANVTWGRYEVTGIWDGNSFTVTKPPRSTKEDREPSGPPDPLKDPSNRGAGKDARLKQIQRELWETDRPLADTRIENGYIFLWVPHDDGTLQTAMDERFGRDMVVVRSQLRPAA